MSFLSPQSNISEDERSRGLTLLVWEGVSTMGFGSIMSSGFITAYALLLGANNLEIGILAALPFIMQPLQLIQTPIVERVKRRKLVAVLAWGIAQSLWILVALIPLLLDVPGSAAVSALLALIGLRGLLGTAMIVNRDSWTRDLVPRDFLASFASRRLAYATVASIVISLAGAAFVDLWGSIGSADNEVLGYTIVIAVGAVFIAMASPVFLALTPEPKMRLPEGPSMSPFKLLALPFRDSNFRRLMIFLFMRGFTTNLAAPFFAVYMLQRIGLPLFAVIAFTVAGQIANVFFLRVWGPMADRLGCKAVLSVSGSLMALVTLCWTFTTMPERHAFTLPMLAALHVFYGIGTAGVNVAMGAFGMKLAPEGNATPYLAGASLAASLGAGISPLLGGRFADYFSVRAFNINVEWIDPTQVLQLPAFSLTGFDFLFAIAFLTGFLTLSRLNAVQEEGETSRDAAMEELLSNSAGVARMVNSVPGLAFAVQIPYGYLKNIPGMDVAVGVSAYQIAASTRAAATAASRSRTSADRVSRGVGRVVAETVRSAGHVGDEGARLALHAARGTMHTVIDTEQDLEFLTKGAVTGTVRVVSETASDPMGIIRSAARGIVRGAYESDVDMYVVALSAVDATREIASELGIDESEAAEHAIEGMLEEAGDMEDETHSRLRDAITPNVEDK